MDRLEISIMLLSQMERTFRIDSEFYKKENIVIAEQIKSTNAKALSDIYNVSDGNHMAISNDFQENTGVPYYRGQDIYNFFIEESTPYHISEAAYNLPFMKRSHLKKGDVLLSIVGAIIGNVSIVTTNNKATCSCKLAILRGKDAEICPEVLITYIKTIYGQNQIQKFRRGASQTGLLLEDMDQIFIPLFSQVFQDTILIAFNNIKNFIIQSNELYTTAQELLLSELGLVAYTQTNEAVSIKTFANSFGASGRLDAEYYQPKYDEVIEKVRKFKHDMLGNLVGIKKSIEPGSDCYGDEGVPFVRVSNLSKYEISEPDIKIPIDTVQNIEELHPQKDTILLSKDGSVGIAYKAIENMKCVTSGAILHLTVNNQSELLPDYLTLVLNSLVVQMQSERDAGGSIIQHWKPSEIAEVIIPILDINTQQQISEKVQQSFDLRKKSTALLEYAKQAVEMAIEQGEDVAMKWLKGVINDWTNK